MQPILKAYMRTSLVFLLVFFAASAIGQNKVDQLIHQPFGAACDLRTVTSQLKGKVVDRTPFENPHAYGITDTIITFQKGKNELAIYDGTYNTFCYGLHIESKRWKLDSELQIKMKKEDFLEAFPKAQPLAEDKYRLWDSDRVDWAEIFFNSRSRVEVINLGFYVD
jgi:hypothetical protein